MHKTLEFWHSYPVDADQRFAFPAVVDTSPDAGMRSRGHIIPYCNNGGPGIVPDFSQGFCQSASPYRNCNPDRNGHFPILQEQAHHLRHGNRALVYSVPCTSINAPN